jgi:hypothetical protein
MLQTVCRIVGTYDSTPEQVVCEVQDRRIEKVPVSQVCDRHVSVVNCYSGWCFAKLPSLSRPANVISENLVMGQFPLREWACAQLVEAVPRPMPLLASR